MAFIRIKRIKGISYAYWVENKWTKMGPRQAKTGYIGKLAELPDVPPPDFESLKPEEKSYLELIDQLLGLELKSRGFMDQNGSLVHENVVVKLKEGISINSRHGALKLNQGILCKMTLKAIREYQGHRDHMGAKLARLLLDSGVRTNEQILLLLYEKAGGKIGDFGEPGETVIYY